MAIPAILIFGATGKIGGALIDELLPDHAAGRVKLIAAVRRPEAAPAFEARGIEARLIDLDIGDACTSWVDTGDVARVAAAALREPKAHAGRAYGLGTEAASMPEIAALVEAVTGLPWRAEAREPAEFFRTITALGADPVYMACVRNVFERTRDGSLKEAADTFDTVQRVTGRAPTTLRDYIEKNRAVFGYSSHT